MRPYLRVWSTEYLVWRWSAAWGLQSLNERARADNEWVYIMLTYEGTATREQRERLMAFGDTVKVVYTWIRVVNVNVKKPVWEELRSRMNVPNRQGVRVLDGRSWHTLIPIPWLWDKIERRSKEGGEEDYVMVDFV